MMIWRGKNRAGDRPKCPLKNYLYRDITKHCSFEIEYLLVDAARHSGLERRYRIERAYGVYMGWRSLVMEHTDPMEFFVDDHRLEQLIELAYESNGPHDIS
jgi:hypothetical protein